MAVQVVMGTLTQWYVPELYRAFSSISHRRLGLASLHINFGYVSSPSVPAIGHNANIFNSEQEKRDAREHHSRIFVLSYPSH